MEANDTFRIDGAPNFRDAGGLRTENQRRLRRGILWRSGDLSQLTPDDTAAIDRLGLDTLVDLRSRHEREWRVSRWPTTTQVEICEADVSAAAGSDGALLRRLLIDRPDADGAHAMMIETFRRMPLQCAAAVRVVIERLAAGRSVLIHCMSGKDRTGVLCAIVQRALLATPEDIRSNYRATDKRVDHVKMREPTAILFRDKMHIELTTEAIDVINATHDDYLTASFAGIDAQFGSFDAYLSRCGVDIELRSALQRRLLIKD